MRKGFSVILLLFFAGLSLNSCSQKPAALDASSLILVSADRDTSALRQKAVALFREEVEKRTHLEIPVRTDTAGLKTPVLLLYAHSSPSLPAKMARLRQNLQPEGFAIRTVKGAAGHWRVVLLTKDNHGILFGLGWLLRKMNWAPGRLTFPQNLTVVTAPETPIRGHQLGYRALSNTYDAWTLKDYDQYIRDLAVFGTNTIELVVTARQNPAKQILMKTPPEEMNARLSRLIHAYGLQVSVWSDVSEASYSTPEAVRKALKIREKWFREIPYIDQWFVPGGDPGNQTLPDLWNFLEKMAALLHKYHPGAKIWVSNQGFDEKKNRAFFEYLTRVHPAWLTGVVYGPWTHLTIEEERARVPARYLLRRYPDITHSLRCQYPVPHWDRAFAIVENREPINPRPGQMANIFNRFRTFSSGFVTYSEGVNDDVNKIVWSALGWNHKQPVREILADYARYFISSQNASALADGFLALEKNWEAPVKGNSHIEKTRKFWENLAQAEPELTRGNWRFQAGLFRANLDALVQQRDFLEARQENRAYTVLKKFAAKSPAAAIDSALAVIHPHPTTTAVEKLKARELALGKKLNKTIGIQLSVPMQHAYGWERGAVLDALNVSLNNREWLLGMLAGIGVQPDVQDQIKGINQILNWENPGPGSFYDDLGNATKEPHLLPGKGWELDPGFVESAQDEFSGDPPQRLSWRDQAQTLYQTPLQLRYTKLDPKAHYTLRVLYAGRFRPTMRLVADDSVEIHGPMKQPRDFIPRSFDIPQSLTQDGTLTLSWYRISGRGCQVAEVWLEKK